MAISYVGKSTFASGTGALTVAAVSGVQANDLILLFVESANQAVTTPSGYTQITGSPVSTGTAAAAGGVRLTSFYRFATGADASVSVADSGDHTTAIKVVYRGVDTTTPFDASAVTGIKTPASTTATFPGITTVTGNAWVVHASALDRDAASTANLGAASNANLTGITERHDQTVTSGVGGGLVIIDGRKATAGATGNTTATVTSTIQVYTTVALRPAPVTGDLDATEGNDAFSSSGEVFIEGSLAATEGTDTFASSGTVSDPAVTGSFAATETGFDTFASTAKLIVQGDLTVSETGQDTFASTGKVITKGTVAATETGNDIFAGSGGTVSTGTFSATETGLDVLSVNGKVLITGSFTVSEAGDDLFASDGLVITKGSFTVTEDAPDTFEASQGVLPREGSLEATEAADFFGGYAEGYVDGYAGGVSGYLGRIGGMAAVESGGAVPFGINAVMKFYDGSTWQILYKDPTIYN